MQPTSIAYVTIEGVPTTQVTATKLYLEEEAKAEWIDCVRKPESDGALSQFP